MLINKITTHINRLDFVTSTHPHTFIYERVRCIYICVSVKGTLLEEKLFIRVPKLALLMQPVPFLRNHQSTHHTINHALYIP